MAIESLSVSSNLARMTISGETTALLQCNKPVAMLYNCAYNTTARRFASCRIADTGAGEL
jgi:hypothetical protein